MTHYSSYSVSNEAQQNNERTEFFLRDTYNIEFFYGILSLYVIQHFTYEYISLDLTHGGCVPCSDGNEVMFITAIKAQHDMALYAAHSTALPPDFVRFTAHTKQMLHEHQ
jgi:hypothetical protein